MSILQKESLSPQGWDTHGIHLQRDGVKRTAYDLLCGPSLKVQDFYDVLPALRGIDSRVLERVGAGRDAAAANDGDLCRQLGTQGTECG